MTDTRTEMAIEQGYRRLAKAVIFNTIWAAQKLSTLQEGTRVTTLTRYGLGLGTAKYIEKEKIEKLKEELDEWIGSDDFFVIARLLGFEPEWLKKETREVLEGGQMSEEGKKLLAAENCNYAVPRGNKKGSNGRNGRNKSRTTETKTKALAATRA